jgi:hypothetical protein
MLRASKFIRLFGPFVVLSFCASAKPQETDQMARLLAIQEESLPEERANEK